MLRPAIIEILDENDSYYSFVISVAKRARDIVDEANEKNEILTRKPIQIAVEQFKNREYIICNDESIDSYDKYNVNNYQTDVFSNEFSSDETDDEDF